MSSPAHLLRCMGTIVLFSLVFTACAPSSPGADLGAPPPNESAIVVPLGETVRAAPGQLVRATDLSVAPDGTVYVFDEGGARIQRFSPDGLLIDIWGAEGSGAGQIGRTGEPDPETPIGSQIAVGPSGVVFTYDRGNDRVQKFTTTGRFYIQWPAHVGDMAVAPDGTLFVSDWSEGLIKHHCPAGRLKGSWGEGGPGQCGPLIPGQRYPITVTDDYSVIVAHPDSGLVERCSRTGEQLETWQVDPRGNVAVGDVVLDPAGNIALTAAGETPLVRFTPSGAPLPAWDYPSGPERGVGSATSIAVGPDGSVYALTGSDRIERFDAAGQRIGSWGPEGTGNGQIDGVGGVAVAPDGTITVADTGNHRLQRFSPEGHHLATWALPSHEDGRLPDPFYVAVGLEGEVYVTEPRFGRVTAFSPTGSVVSVWGEGAEDGALVAPSGIAAAPDGTMVVVDSNRSEVLRLDTGGEVLHAWGGEGSDDGQLRNPSGVAVASDGSVYVADTLNHRVQRFDPEGRFVAAWDTPADANPTDITVTEDGHVLVASIDGANIARYTPDGAALGEWGAVEIGDGTPLRPAFIAAAPDGTVLATDMLADRVVQMSPEGVPKRAWGTGEDGVRQLAVGSEDPSETPALDPEDSWTVEVFPNRWLAGPPVDELRIDTVDFDWGVDPVFPGVPPSNTSLRLERALPAERDTYEVEVHAEGGVRLWLDGELTFDRWDGPEVDARAKHRADGPVHARLEFADQGGPASLRLIWRRHDPSATEQP